MHELGLLLLPKFSRLGASSRLRTLQYMPWLETAGFDISVQPLISNELLTKRYKNGSYGLALLFAYVLRLRALISRARFGLLWIEKEALPWFPVWVELTLLKGVPYVLDYDDAVFHNYDQHRNGVVRRVFRRRLDRLMAHASLVIVGNNYLAQRAQSAGAKWVEIVPTVVDLARYPEPQKVLLTQTPEGDSRPRIVWIGSPSTVQYLDLLREPLRKLATLQTFVFRVIGGGPVEIPGVQVEEVPWSELTEVDDISDCQVGVMPLLDSFWERGKCGYKLIQYMACGLPVVASDVGANSDIVIDDLNGYLARGPEDWVGALAKLLSSPKLRAEMGANGRRRVEEQYCIQKTGPRMAQFLLRAFGQV